MDNGHEKNQPNQIILAFDLAAFNGPLTLDFIEIQPTVSRGLMTIKLGMVPDHGV